MQHDDWIGLRFSIALHVVVLGALETTIVPVEPKPREVPVKLVMLPSRSPTLGGERPTDPKVNCHAVHRQHLSAVKKDFDIARAPLETALWSFVDETGLAFQVKTRLLAYRWGSPVHGAYTPVEAADRLIKGSGLCGRWMGRALILDRCRAGGAVMAKPTFGAETISQPDPCDVAESPVPSP